MALANLMSTSVGVASAFCSVLFRIRFVSVCFVQSLFRLIINEGLECSYERGHSVRFTHKHLPLMGPCLEILQSLDGPPRPPCLGSYAIVPRTRGAIWLDAA